MKDDPNSHLGGEVPTHTIDSIAAKYASCMFPMSSRNDKWENAEESQVFSFSKKRRISTKATNLEEGSIEQAAGEQAVTQSSGQGDTEETPAELSYRYDLDPAVCSNRSSAATQAAQKR